MSFQTIKRAPHDKNNPYKMMRRATFEDNRLSFEARGVLSYILVKPDDWEISIPTLMREGNIGRDKAYRILDELITHRYCKRIEYRDKGGKFSGILYEIHEESYDPNESVPLPEKPYPGEPNTENTDSNNKEELPTKKEKSVPAAQDAPPTAENKPLTEHQQMFDKTCDIVGIDYHTITEDQRGQVNQTVGILRKAGYTLVELNRFGPEVWAHDWRWKKNRDRPSLSQLRQEIGKLRAKPIILPTPPPPPGAEVPFYVIAQQQKDFYQ